MLDGLLCMEKKRVKAIYNVFLIECSAKVKHKDIAIDNLRSSAVSTVMPYKNHYSRTELRGVLLFPE